MLAVSDINVLPTRLGVITGTVGFRDPSTGIVWLNHSIGRLLEEIGKHVTYMHIGLPLIAQRKKFMNHALQIEAQSITALPPLETTLKAQPYYFETRKKVQKIAEQSDALFIRLPFQLPAALYDLGKPTLLHVVSNPREIIEASSDYVGPMRWLARGLAYQHERSMQRLVCESQNRTATNGRQMWDVLKCQRGRVVVSSCLYRHEMQARPNLQISASPKILYVGYLRPEKGILDLLDAFDLLRQSRSAQLTLVGDSDRQTRVTALIQQRIAASPYAADIFQEGMVDFGENLFDYYKTHDVFVLPSLSEGTPRTLVEARSFGCPVIASNVGGIAASVQEGVDGLLVNPRAPHEISAAIQRLFEDEALRHALIKKGLERSRRWSLEAFAQDLMEEFRELF